MKTKKGKRKPQPQPLTISTSASNTRHILSAASSAPTPTRLATAFLREKRAQDDLANEVRREVASRRFQITQALAEINAICAEPSNTIGQGTHYSVATEDMENLGQVRPLSHPFPCSYLTAMRRRGPGTLFAQPSRQPSPLISRHTKPLSSQVRWPAWTWPLFPIISQRHYLQTRTPPPGPLLHPPHTSPWAAPSLTAHLPLGRSLTQTDPETRRLLHPQNRRGRQRSHVECARVFQRL